MSAALQGEKSSFIYLARHGETPGNVEFTVKNPFEEHLTEKGQKQALQLGKDLKDVKFTKIYCSDYPRAMETTNIVTENSNCNAEKVKINVDERIREWDDSYFLGKSYGTIFRLQGKGIDANHPYFEYSRFCVEGMEPVEKIIARLESFFDELCEQLDKSATPETVLVVAHGCIIRIFMTHIRVSNKYDAISWSDDLTYGLDNCAYHKFAIPKKSDLAEPRTIKLVSMHNCEHLCI